MCPTCFHLNSLSASWPSLNGYVITPGISHKLAVYRSFKFLVQSRKLFSILSGYEEFSSSCNSSAVTRREILWKLSNYWLSCWVSENFAFQLSCWNLLGAVGISSVWPPVQVLLHHLWRICSRAVNCTVCWCRFAKDWLSALPCPYSMYTTCFCAGFSWLEFFQYSFHYLCYFIILGFCINPDTCANLDLLRLSV